MAEKAVKVERKTSVMSVLQRGMTQAKRLREILDELENDATGFEMASSFIEQNTGVKVSSKSKSRENANA